jgi:Leu/Phe-tRNA-protein transferase
MLKINYTQSGHIFIGPEDDPQAIARAMAETGYENEFCIADDFSLDFIARLMAAGFLVMSLRLNGHGRDHDPPVYILTPKLHFERSVIFFDDFHEPRSARRLIPRYELRVDTGTEAPEDFSLFDSVLERCATIHGDDWLTLPLRESFRQLHASRNTAINTAGAAVHTTAFGLYREGRLVAGEFGVAAGKVYTSYSGYYDEDSAGTVQLILTGRYLRDAGFAFWDLGMPMEYKTRLGAREVEREEFLEMVRKAAASKG